MKIPTLTTTDFQQTQFHRVIYNLLWKKATLKVMFNPYIIMNFTAYTSIFIVLWVYSKIWVKSYTVLAKKLAKLYLK